MDAERDMTVSMENKLLPSFVTTEISSADSMLRSANSLPLKGKSRRVEWYVICGIQCLTLNAHRTLVVVGSPGLCRRVVS